MKIDIRISMAILLAVSVMTPASKAMADNVDGKKARSVGAYFMSAQFGNKSITPASLEEVYIIPNVEKDIPALYAFNVPGNRGFVIVSGSECVEPIVAYSTDGPLDPDNMPPAMQWWLGQQANMIAYCQNEDLEATDHAVESWRILEEKRLPYFGKNPKLLIVRLLETTWNQNYPYNSLCPVVNNGSSDSRYRAYVGCVATAMAQILRYWKYPVKGNGSHSYSLTDAAAGLDTVFNVNFADAIYNYDKMPASITSDSSAESIYEISKLGLHCGISVDMGYSGEGSGAQSAKVKDAFVNYFKYNADSINYLSRESFEFRNDNRTTNPNYRDSAWVNIIINEIMNNRPVYYGGFSPYGGQDAGHAFVCDGYRDDSGFLHFNWGWGGSGDTWCNVYTAQLKPSRSPQAGVTYNFFQSNKIIVGITPPQDSIHVDTPESIAETGNPFLCGIYPNPASSQVTVSYSLKGDDDAILQLFDATGRVVKQIEVSPVSTQAVVSVSDLTPGIYFCRLNGYTQKFVVR